MCNLPLYDLQIARATVSNVTMEPAYRNTLFAIRLSTAVTAVTSQNRHVNGNIGKRSRASIARSNVAMEDAGVQP